MFTAIIIALVVIALIATGVGIDFGAMLAILAGLVAVLLFVAWLWPNENDPPEKAKKKKLISKIILIALAVVVVVIIIGAIVGLIGTVSSSPSDRAYDDAMGSVDWGDGYYYDSNDNAVKKTYW